MKTTELDEKAIASLDKKIQKLQDKVCQKHAEYNALTEELNLDIYRDYRLADILWYISSCVSDLSR